MEPDSEPILESNLILASTSPYRRRLLERLGLPFRIEDPAVQEIARAKEPAETMAARLARAKAFAVSKEHPSAWVIGSDQTATCADRVLRKPGSEAAARAQLTACRGKTAVFFTSVALFRNSELVSEEAVETAVTFRELSELEVERYVERDKPLDCAGGFRWEGIGICLFSSLRSGDPTALEGLPLIAVSKMLRDQGLNPLLSPI